jgi:hypothetical protein
MPRKDSEKRKAARKAYNKSPKGKTTQRARRCTPEYRAVDNEREQTPKYRATRIKYRKEIKRSVFAHYDTKCSWPGCNITDEDMLQIDHIDGGGRKHYEEMGGGGGRLYRWLLENNFPAGFRILCANHNWKHKANMERAKAAAEHAEAVAV